MNLADLFLCWTQKQFRKNNIRAVCSRIAPRVFKVFLFFLLSSALYSVFSLYYILYYLYYSLLFSLMIHMKVNTSLSYISLLSSTLYYSKRVSISTLYSLLIYFYFYIFSSKCVSLVPGGLQSWPSPEGKRQRWWPSALASSSVEAEPLGIYLDIYEYLWDVFKHCLAELMGCTCNCN